MESLEKFRQELNVIDKDLIGLLGRRFEIITAVGEYKKKNNIEMMQPKRVDAVKSRCAEMGEAFGLDNDFVRNLYALIIDEACRVEDLIIEKN